MNAPFDQSDGGLTAPNVRQDAIAGAVAEQVVSADRGRLHDYLQLTKFRLSLLVLTVTAAGYWYAAGPSAHLVQLLHVVLGTALVAFAANAANQVMERDPDRLMRRTMNRPIPTGRISRIEAVAFCVVSCAAGVVYLWVLVNPLASALALATIGLYLIAYTPLKRVTSLNTLVGAIPGAIPPVIGVAAAQGSLTIEAWLLFGILFFWQLPHFFAIAWLYREDYARGGYRMLSVVDKTGTAVSRQTIAFQICLIVASLVPSFVGAAGVFYLMGAGALGYGLLICAVRFALERTRLTARTLLLATIAYLPLLMGLLLADRLMS